MKTLIITDSWDATSDIVVHRLGEDVFRLNSDLIRDYKVEWNQHGFYILNPSGRGITLSEIESVYWRKPFTSQVYEDTTHPEYFFFSECRYLIRELYNVSKAKGAFALVEEGAERRLGKVCQLLLAKQYFKVPEWNIILGHECAAPPFTIVKSLSGEQIDIDRTFYTTRVDERELDPRYVWLFQHAIDKSADVTVCYVNGQVFAFELTAVPGIIDWRVTLGTLDMQSWRPLVLSAEVVVDIREFMAKCGLKYGRLDFVAKGEDLFFLEVNPNGQWAWLDLEDDAGLITAMVLAIRGQG